MDITADTTEFVTLEEFLAHLNKSEPTEEDTAELQRHLNAAQRHVERRIGAILWRTQTQRARFGSSRDTLRHYPVVAVDSVEVDGDAWTDHDVNIDAGSVSCLPRYGEVVITYTVGRTSIDDDVRMATLIIGKHLWETQRGRNANRAGTPSEGDKPLVGFLIPHRAAALLEPFETDFGVA